MHSEHQKEEGGVAQSSKAMTNHNAEVSKSSNSYTQLLVVGKDYDEEETKKQKHQMKRQGSVGLPKVSRLDTTMMSQVQKLNDLNQVTSTSNNLRNQILFSAIGQQRKSYSSAKARIRNLNEPISPDDSFHIDKAFSGQRELQLGSMGQENSQQKMHRDRIQNAVKKPKDLFDLAPQAPIKIAQYVIGKNNRAKNPQKQRSGHLDIPPKGGVAGNKTTAIKKRASLSPQEKVTVAKKRKHFQKSPSMPSDLFVSDALKGRLGSTSLPRINQSTQGLIQADDNQTVETPRLNNPGIQGGSANINNQKLLKRSSNTLKKQSVLSIPDATRTTDDAINLEMFKKNKIKDFSGKNQVQIVLDKVFPSTEKEDRDMKRMIRSQTFLLVDVNDNNTAQVITEGAVVLNADIDIQDQEKKIDEQHKQLSGSNKQSFGGEVIDEQSQQVKIQKKQSSQIQQMKQQLTPADQNVTLNETTLRLQSSDPSFLNISDRQQLHQQNESSSKKQQQISPQQLNNIPKNYNTQPQIDNRHFKSASFIAQKQDDSSPTVKVTVIKNKQDFHSNSSFGYVQQQKPPKPSNPVRLKNTSYARDEQNANIRRIQMQQQLQLYSQKVQGGDLITIEEQESGHYDQEQDQQELQAVEYQIQMPRSSNDYVQAQKLAHILSKAQQQRSASQGRQTQSQIQQRGLAPEPMSHDLRQKISKLYTSQSQGQLHTLPSYNKTQQKSQDQIEKEFLSKIDLELRAQTNKKIEAVKNQSLDRLQQQTQECGLDQTNPSIFNKNQTALNRNTSPFTQNVRSMNFFSIFVNNSVEDQIETEKLVAESSGTNFYNQAAIENMNKDNKDLAIDQRPDFHLPIKSSFAPPLPIEVSKAVNDRKDEKFQKFNTTTNETSVTCKCNSLSNEMIQQLLIDSPIKDIVEEIHSYQFFHQNLVKGRKMVNTSQSHLLDPLKKALEGAGQNGVESAGKNQINQRTDVAVLNILLNQILLGKYTFEQDQIFKKQAKDGRPDWSNPLDRFLKGINFKEMLSDIQQKILKKQEGVLDVFEESDEDDDEDKDFFQLKLIKEKELVLAELLETRKMPEKKKFEPGDVATFLTQVYKESELTQKELEDKFPNWAKARNIQKLSKQMIENHALTKENVAQQKSISEAKLRKEKEVKELFDQIHNIAQQAEKSAINFFQDQTTLPEVEQANNAGQEQLLYLCFLEIVRQVSGQCKEQSLFLVKLWHSYFDHYGLRMQRELGKIANQTSKISALLETMTRKFAKVLAIDEQKDMEFLTLIDKHDKAMSLIELTAKSLYQEREQTNELRSQIETLKENFKDVLPNYEKYFANKELRQRLMKYSILEKTDSWGSSERQQLHMTGAIKKVMEEQMERDPFQARIIKDVYRITSVVDMKMPVDYALENAKEAFQKSAVALKMKEIYFKNLQERAQRLKRSNEDHIRRISDMQEAHTIEMIQKEFEAKERIQTAVKKFRQEQLKSILEEPKEVQTDHELMERYFADLENQKEMGIRAMMVSRKLSSVQMQQLKVMKAFQKHPKFHHTTKPIVHIMRRVRDDKSKFPPKTLKKTLEIICEMIQERLKIIDRKNEDPINEKMNLEHFYAKFMSQKYGIDSITFKYTEQWLVSIKANAPRDSRIMLMMRFLGLGGFHSLPFSVFKFYLHLLKATNIDMEFFYQDISASEIKLSYQKCMSGFKELCAKTDVFNRRLIMTQLRQNSIVVAQNPVILKELSFAMFETYRYVLEKLVKSQKYRSFSDLLNALFEQHSYYHENIKNKKRKAIGNKKKKIRHLKSVVLKKSKSNMGDGEDVNTLNVSIMEKTDEEDQVSDGSQLLSEQEEDSKLDSADRSRGAGTPQKTKRDTQREQERIERLKSKEKSRRGKSYPNSEIKDKHKNKDKGEDSQDEEQTQKVRVADAAEEEKDYVKLSSMVRFFLKELKMTRNSDEVRLYDLFEVILINAQMANPERISRFHALRTFTEKIEIQVPLEAYFYIGINAKIDDENSENMWLEKVFNFYSQLQPDNYKAASGMDPDHRLVFTGQSAYDGLEFVQFYIFVKDGGSKYGKDKVKIFNIYEDECAQRNRQRLSCDDFIELIRKFNLIKAKPYFENKMRIRYDQAKQKLIYLNVSDQTTQISRNNLNQLIPSAQQTMLDRIDEHSKRSRSQLSASQKSQSKKGQKANENFIDFGTETINICNFQALENSSDEDEVSRRQAIEQFNKPNHESFDQQFENSRVPFKTNYEDKSRHSILTKIAGPSSFLPTDASQLIDKKLDSEQQMMSPEIQMSGPSMLEISPIQMAQSNFGDAVQKFNSVGERRIENTVSVGGFTPNKQFSLIKTVSTPNLTTKSQQLLDPKNPLKEPSLEYVAQPSFGTPTPYRPPSPIKVKTDNTMIIDLEVQDTIAKITEQLETPSMILANRKKLVNQLTGEQRPFIPMEPVVDENLISETISQIDINKFNGDKDPTGKHNDIILSQIDNFKAHAIEGVDLLGYDRNQTQLYKVKSHSPQDVSLADDHERSSQNSKMKEQLKQDEEKGLGYLELMFGGHDNTKLNQLTRDAKSQIEAESAKIIKNVQNAFMSSMVATTPRRYNDDDNSNDSPSRNKTVVQQKSSNEEKAAVPSQSYFEQYQAQLRKTQNIDDTDAKRKEDSGGIISRHNSSEISIHNVLNTESNIKEEENVGRNMLIGGDLTQKYVSSSNLNGKHKQTHHHRHGHSMDTGSKLQNVKGFSPKKNKEQLRGTTSGISEWPMGLQSNSVADLSIAPDKQSNHDLLNLPDQKYKRSIPSAPSASSLSKQEVSQHNVSGGSSSMIKKMKTVKKKKKKPKILVKLDSSDIIMRKKTNLIPNDDIEGLLDGDKEQDEQQPASMRQQTIHEAQELMENVYDGDDYSNDRSNEISIIDDNNRKVLSSSLDQQSMTQLGQRFDQHSRNSLTMSKNKSTNNIVPLNYLDTNQSQKESNDQAEQRNEYSQLSRESLKKIQKTNPDSQNQAEEYEEEIKQDINDNQIMANFQHPELPKQDFNFGNFDPNADKPKKLRKTKSQVRAERKKLLEEQIKKDFEESQAKRWDEKQRTGFFAQHTYDDDEEDQQD